MSIDVFREVLYEKEVKELIKKLEKAEITPYDVPDELINDFDIVKAERSLGLRKRLYQLRLQLIYHLMILKYQQCSILSIRSILKNAIKC